MCSLEGLKFCMWHVLEKPKRSMIAARLFHFVFRVTFGELVSGICLADFSKPKSLSGWWLQNISSCLPRHREMIQFDEHIFQMGWYQLVIHPHVQNQAIISHISSMPRPFSGTGTALTILDYGGQAERESMKCEQL